MVGGAAEAKAGGGGRREEHVDKRQTLSPSHLTLSISTSLPEGLSLRIAL